MEKNSVTEPSRFKVKYQDISKYFFLFFSNHFIQITSFQDNFRGLDTLGKIFIRLHKGDNFCDFLFAFVSNKPLLKRGLL